MIRTENKEISKADIHIPKNFWKYYDLYRRRHISLDEFSGKSGIEKETIIFYLSTI